MEYLTLEQLPLEKRWPNTAINDSRVVFEHPSPKPTIRQTGLIDVNEYLMQPKKYQKYKRRISTVYDDGDKGRQLIKLIYDTPDHKVLTETSIADYSLLKSGVMCDLLVATRYGDQVHYTVPKTVKVLVNAMFSAHENGEIFLCRYFVGIKHKTLSPSFATGPV